MTCKGCMISIRNKTMSWRESCRPGLQSSRRSYLQYHSPEERNCEKMLHLMALSSPICPHGPSLLLPWWPHDSLGLPLGRFQASKSGSFRMSIIISIDEVANPTTSPPLHHCSHSWWRWLGRSFPPPYIFPHQAFLCRISRYSFRKSPLLRLHTFLE